MMNTDREMLEAAAARVRVEKWVNPEARARYLRVLENASWSLYCVLAGTPSDRGQCAAEWAELLK
jgi:hypothetical protein